MADELAEKFFIKILLRAFHNYKARHLYGYKTFVVKTGQILRYIEKEAV